MVSITGLIEQVVHSTEPSYLPITEFGVVLLVALTLGLVLSRFGITTSIGFILTGLILGQQGLHYITQSGITVALGEIGLLAILFYLGLEVNLKKFKETGGIAAVLAIVEMAGAFAVGFILAQLFGFGSVESLIIGAILMAASTVEAVKFIFEKNILQSLESRITISVLIVQDILAVLLVAFLLSLGSAQSFNIAVLNAVIFVIAMFFVVGKISTPLLRVLDTWGHQDKMFLYALGMGIAVSFIGVFLGLSAVLGAYFAGFALAETGYADKIKREFAFFRDLFLLFFFVSFGAHVLLPTSLNLVLFILALVAVYSIVKLVSYGVFGTALGLNIPSSVAVGAMLIPIGEFGVLFASLASGLNSPNCQALGTCLVSNPGELSSIAFSIIILTTLLGPFIFKRASKVSTLLLSVYPASVRRRVILVGEEIQGLEDVFITQAFRNKTAVLLKHLVSNLVIAVSVVYLAFILRREITLEFLQFLPTELSLSLLLLPVIIWPLFNFAKNLKELIYVIEHSLYSLVFKNQGEHAFGFDLVAGFLMSLLGIIATLLIYAAYPDVLLAIVVPGVYALLSVFFLSKSIYEFLDHYSTLRPHRRSFKH
ncbi:cation:proton antiporter [Candidatus Micrarchaeota archaeon]|nr:cation:proton antiporter [Candidatus Micrarchaeota archaeon]